MKEILRTAVDALFSLLETGSVTWNGVTVQHAAFSGRPQVRILSEAVQLTWVSGVTLELGEAQTAVTIATQGEPLKLTVPHGLGQHYALVRLALSGKPFRANGALITLPRTNPLPLLKRVSQGLIRGDWAPPATARRYLVTAEVRGLSIQPNKLELDVHKSIFGKDVIDNPVWEF